MGKSYVFSGTFVVCSFQISSTPQQLVEYRGEQTVRKINKDVILTQADKNIQKNFTCKVPLNQLSSFVAFGAGLAAIGVASVAAASGASIGILSTIAVFSGPVGWGLIAVGAIFVGIGAYLYSKKTSPINPCTGPLNNGYWMAYKQRVKFNEKEAVTHASVLVCGAGGILRPFLTEEAAKNACSSVRNSNLGEIGVNTLIAALTGLFLPITILGTGAITFAGTIANVVKLGVFGIAAGTTVTWGLLWAHSEYMQSDPALKGNKYYKTMNQSEPTDKREPYDPLGGSIDGFMDNLTSMDDPSDTNDLLALGNFIQASKGSWQFIKDVSLLQKLQTIEGLSSAQLRDSSYAQSILKEILYGKYPQLREHSPDLARMIDSYTNKRGRLINVNKKLKSQFRNAALNAVDDIAVNRANSVFKFTGQGATFFLPFLGNYFSERAKKKLAMAAAGEAKVIYSDRPLGN